MPEKPPNLRSFYANRPLASSGGLLIVPTKRLDLGRECLRATTQSTKHAVTLQMWVDTDMVRNMEEVKKQSTAGRVVGLLSIPPE